MSTQTQECKEGALNVLSLRSNHIMLAGRVRVSQVFRPPEMPPGRNGPWVVRLETPTSLDSGYPLELVVAWSVSSAEEATRAALSRGLRPGEINHLILTIEPVSERRNGATSARLRCTSWGLLPEVVQIVEEALTSARGNVR